MKNSNELDEAIGRVHELVDKHVKSGAIDDLDNMTVKDLKLKVLGETERILGNDSKASIVSVIVYVAVT